jgi:hypothetical protein
MLLYSYTSNLPMKVVAGKPEANKLRDISLDGWIILKWNTV